MKIEGLRGVTRVHLASHGDDYDVFLEVCHGAEKKDFPDAFAINGYRYVVVNTETGEEFTAMFASHVEEFLAKPMKEKDESCDSNSILKCPNCGATDDESDLEENEVGMGYVCNNCLFEPMEWL